MIVAIKAAMPTNSVTSSKIMRVISYPPSVVDRESMFYKCSLFQEQN
jgi:hypothetical protein